jgi:DNA-directed RNA polymerase subunit H (RpoH/RPB5)
MQSNSISSTENKEIFKSRNILLSQLKQQNFNVSEYENINIMEIGVMIDKEQLDMLITHNTDGRKCYVKYFTGKSLRANNIMDFIDDLFVQEEILNKNTDDLIIIVKDEPNDTLIRNLKDLWEQNKYFIRVITRKRLQFNILEHEYVPQHIIMTQEETEELFKRKNILDKSNLPEISRFDPVSLVIGIRPGQVCRIIRNSRTAISTNYYRICV